MKRFHTARLLAGSAALMMPATAFAQATATPPADSISAAPDGQTASPQAATPSPQADQGVGDIIVTAQRVEQRLQDVPVAVTPVTARQLEDQRLHDLPQLTLAVPSLEVTTDNAFTLRGVGSQIFTENVDSSVGVTVDDVSLGVPVFMSNAAFMDIAQIEALTGPQGLLFGRNSSAGLLNIITNRPRLNSVNGLASLEYDNRDAAPGGHLGLVATGVLNLPTSSTSALRLNALESVQDPVTKAVVNTSPNAQFKQARLQLKAKWLWQPTDALTVYLIGDYSRERGLGGIWDDSWRSAPAGGNTARNTAAEGVTPGPENLYHGTSGPDFRSVDTGGASANVSYKLSPAITVSDIFAWRTYHLNFNLDSDITSSATGLDINGRTSDYTQFSNELRLAFDTAPVSGQVGLYSFWSKNTSDTTLNGQLNTPIPKFIYGTNNYETRGRSLALYGQVTGHLTDALQLIAGARVTNDRIFVDARADNFNQTLQSTPFGTLPIPLVLAYGPTNQVYTDTRYHTNVSYKVGAQYNVQRDVMFYATYSTGYKGPAFSTSLAYTGQDPYIRPETVDDLEGGVKAVLFDRKLRLNIAAFTQKFHDLQSQSFTPGGVAILGNAEGSRSRGIELNSTLRPVPALTINYNATLLDSRYTRYSTDPCYTGQSAATCPNGTFFEGAGINLPTAAHYHGTLEAVYDIPVSDSGRVSVSGNWYHRSSINFSTAAAPFLSLGPIDVFGANIAFRSSQGYEVSIFCKNCTNKLYPNFVGQYPGDAALGVVSTFNRWGYNSVRNIGAAVTFRF